MLFFHHIIVWFDRIVSLKHIEDLMGTWGYPLLFAMLFSCGLGVPIPEDIPLLLAGYFVANGKMQLCYAAICAWCGIIGGDCILYSFGYRYGLGITKVPIIGTHVTARRIQYAERLFQKYGPWVVGVGRMFAGIRGAMVIAAGTIRYHFVKFFIADGFGAVLSGGLFMSLGYWAGTKLGDLEQLRKKMQHYEHVVVGLLVLVVVAFFVWNAIRRRLHHSKAVEQVIEKVIEPAPLPADSSER